MVVRVEEEEEAAALDAPWDLRWSEEATGADSGFGTACGEVGIEVVGSAGGGARAGNAGEPFVRRTGPAAGTGGVGAEAGRWRGWAGGAERW